LSAALQSRLCQQFSGCLCVACLQALSDEEPAGRGPADAASALT
jgi:hypothetical protein